MSKSIVFCVACYSKQALASDAKCALSAWGCPGTILETSKPTIIHKVEAAIKETNTQICLTCDTLQPIAESHACVLESLMGCNDPLIQLSPSMVEDLRKADIGQQDAKDTPYKQARDRMSQSEQSYAAPAAPPQESKKNQPLTMAQQTAQLDELKNKLNFYTGGPHSPGTKQSLQDDDDSSSEHDDSEGSEED